MLRRYLILAAGCTAALLSVNLVPQLLAQDKSGATAVKQEVPQAPVLQRIVRTDGRVFEGEVTETPDGYQVKVKTGDTGAITVTIRKNDVKQITRVEPEKPTEEGITFAGRLPSISDGDIADILGETPAFLKNVAANPYKILRDKLDIDVDSVEEMKSIAGKKALTYETAHFVFVYTSERSQAVELAAKLEGIYEWVIKYMEQLEIPPHRPKAKLEVYFFGTHEEFKAYQTLHGSYNLGILGLYYPTTNRSGFFEMHTWPPVARTLEQLKDKGVDPARRRKLNNQLDEFSTFHNLEVVQHEAAHQVHFNLGVFPLKWTEGVPRWAVEGLATMFEVPQSSQGGSLGAVNHKRLQEFRETFKDVEKIPPEAMRLFIIGSTYLGSDYNVYVMGWALHHYLRGAHRAGYAKYMQLLASRDNPRLTELTPTAKQKEFEDIFGPVDENWMKAFAKYMNDITFVPSAVSVNPFGGP